MTPIKNGVMLNMREYGNFLRADAYLLPKYGWLFRVNNTWCTGVSEGGIELLDFDIVGFDDWFDKLAAYGTMVVPYARCLVTHHFLDRLDQEERALLYQGLDGHILHP